MNARSIRNKISLIQAQINTFDIITVSETWLKPSIENDTILLNGFHPPLRKDRPTEPWGGVAIYVSNKLICKARPDLDIAPLEAVWAETKIGQDTLLIGSFYRPQDSGVAYWRLIDDSIQRAGNTPHKYIVLGDFNTDCTNGIPTNLNNLLVKNNMFQLVTSPTRVTENTSTIIDLCLTPCRDIVGDVSVIPPKERVY